MMTFSHPLRGLASAPRRKASSGENANFNGSFAQSGRYLVLAGLAFGMFDYLFYLVKSNFRNSSIGRIVSIGTSPKLWNPARWLPSHNWMVGAFLAIRKWFK